ncbi:helix-turn-helix transcriptional regulator [Bacteroides fragilis]|nr:helix-turn-helix transcriptional regulator [Bacteroides fragilis]
MESYKVLKNRRSILRISQEDLAEISEISLSTIKNIERGKGNSSLKTIEKICEVLGLEICLNVKKQAKNSNTYERIRNIL